MLERLQFCLGRFANLDVTGEDRMRLVHQKDENLSQLPAILAFQRAIEFHLDDRDLPGVVKSRYPAVAVRIDADKDVGVVYHLERNANAVGVTSGQLLHADRKDSFVQTCFHSLLPVLRQVERRAADHRSQLSGLVHRPSQIQIGVFCGLLSPALSTSSWV